MKKILVISILISALLMGCSNKAAEKDKNIHLKENKVSSSESLDKGKDNINGSNSNEGSTYENISGTSLSFIPLLDFSKANGFVGYESLKYKASILATELPVPNGKEAIVYFDNIFTSETLKAKGLNFISKEKNVNNTKSLLVKCGITKNSIDYIQWIYILKGESNKVAQIQISAPKDEFKKIENEIVKMLFSFRWKESTEGFNTYYSIKLPEGWKLAKQQGVVEFYSESGKFPLSQGESSISVSNLSKSVNKEERKKYVEKMNLNRNYYSDLKLISSRDLNIDGFEANISYVSGLETRSSKQVIKQYCYIFLDTTTVLIEGDRTEKLDNNTFDNIVSSWKLKR